MARTEDLTDINAFAGRVAERMLVLREYGIQERHIRRRAGLEDQSQWARVFTLADDMRMGELRDLAWALFTTPTWLLTGSYALMPSGPSEQTIRMAYCQCLEADTRSRMPGTPASAPRVNPDCPTHGELSQHPFIHSGTNSLIYSPRA